MKLEKYIELLESNTMETTRLLEIADSLQIMPPDGGWSVAQVLERLLLTERFIYEQLHKPSLYKATDIVILGEFKLRKLLIETDEAHITPAFPEPGSHSGSIKQLLKRFTETRKLLLQELRTGKLIIDRRYYINPHLGEMTAMDWLIFIPLHAERQLLQTSRLLNDKLKHPFAKMPALNK